LSLTQLTSVFPCSSEDHPIRSNNKSRNTYKINLIEAERNKYWIGQVESRRAQFASCMIICMGT
jgi:hypothetical protein